jgi:hypothetical protein
VSEPAKCRACGVPLIHHLGHEGQCDRLQKLAAAARELIAVCRVILRDGAREETRRDLAWRVHCCEVYAHEPSKAASKSGNKNG